MPLVNALPPLKVPVRFKLPLDAASTVRTAFKVLCVMDELSVALPETELVMVPPPDEIVMAREAKGVKPRRSKVPPELMVRLLTAEAGPRAPA